MKILAISNYVGDPKLKQDSAIHLWRIKRPILELQKHVDWQIDFQRGIVRDYKGLEQEPEEFIKKHGFDEVRNLGQYDIIFTSYFTSPHQYTLLWAANKRYGTKVIIDFDDDLFDVDPSNFAFWQSAGWQGHEFLKTIASIAPHICTTNEKLAEKIKSYNDQLETIHVIPNYISDMYPDGEVDNKDKIVIGYFGGASHYLDLHDSGVLRAIQKLMQKHKNLYFKICGQPADKLPKSRVEDVPVAQGILWPTERLPSLNLDIAVAPILTTVFNKHKSDIKWQEATRMGSAVIVTDYGAYADLPDDVVVKTKNTRNAWIEAIETLLDKETRKGYVKRAKDELKKRRLEDHWVKYKEMFEKVYGKA